MEKKMRKVIMVNSNIKKDKTPVDMEVSIMKIMEYITILFLVMAVINCGDNKIDISGNRDIPSKAVKVSGEVYEDMGDGIYNPVGNALIKNEEKVLAVTSSDGYYSFDIELEGNNIFTVESEGYIKSSISVNSGKENIDYIFLQRMDLNKNILEEASNPAGYKGCSKKNIRKKKIISIDRQAKAVIESYSINRKTELRITAYNSVNEIKKNNQLKNKGIILCGADITLKKGVISKSGTKIIPSAKNNLSGIDNKTLYRLYKNSKNNIILYYFTENEWKYAGEGEINSKNKFNVKAKKGISIPSFSPFVFIMKEELTKVILKGKVINSITGEGVGNVLIRVETTGDKIKTDNDGCYSLETYLPYSASMIVMRTFRTLYYSKTAAVEINENGDSEILKTVNIIIKPKKYVFIRGTVTDSDSVPVKKAAVYLENSSGFTKVKRRNNSIILKKDNLALYTWSYVKNDNSKEGLILEGIGKNTLSDTDILISLKNDGIYSGVFNLKCRIDHFYPEYTEEEQVASFEVDIKFNGSIKYNNNELVSVLGGDKNGYYYYVSPYKNKIKENNWRILAERYNNNIKKYEVTAVSKKYKRKRFPVRVINSFLNSNIDKIFEQAAYMEYDTCIVKIIFEGEYRNRRVRTPVSAGVSFIITEDKISLKMTRMKKYRSVYNMKLRKKSTNKKGRYKFRVPLKYSSMLKVYAEKKGYSRTTSVNAGKLDYGEEKVVDLILPELNSKPEPPDYIKVTAEDTDVVILWSASNNTDGYYIYFDNDNTGEYQGNDFYAGNSPIETTDGQMLNLKGLHAGRWFFKIKSYNRYGLSDFSEEAEVTVFDPAVGTVTGYINYTEPVNLVSDEFIIDLYSCEDRYMHGEPEIRFIRKGLAGDYTIYNIQPGNYIMRVLYNSTGRAVNENDLNGCPYTIYENRSYIDVKSGDYDMLNIKAGEEKYVNFIFDNKFVWDDIKPYVTEVEPADKSENVPVNPVIEIKFSEPVDIPGPDILGWLTGAADSLTEPDIIEWSDNNTVLRIEWTEVFPFDYETEYFFSSRTDGKSAVDFAGNKLEYWEYSFKTEPLPLFIPVIDDMESPNTTGNYIVSWNKPMEFEFDFELQESDNSYFENAVTVYSGQEQSIEISDKLDGEYYYRVRSGYKGRFSEWSGYKSITVNKYPEADVYVDGVSGNDSWDGKSPVWDGLSSGPKRSITEGINVSQSGEKCYVMEGYYMEKFVLKSGVNLEGAGMYKTVIDGMGIIEGYEDRIVMMKPGSRIAGFSIINGGCFGIEFLSASGVVENNYISHNSSSGIYLIGSSSKNTVIRNNIITDCGNSGGIYIYCVMGSPQIINNTIVDNRGPGIYLSLVSSTIIKNNIIVMNSGAGINVSSGGSPQITYNDLWNNSTNYSGCSGGTGNIYVNPLFIDYYSGDYRLQENSPCIGSSDPSGSSNNIGWQN